MRTTAMTTAPFNALLQDASPRLVSWMKSHSGRVHRVLGRFRYPADEPMLMRPFNLGSVVILKKQAGSIPAGTEGIITDVLTPVDDPQFLTEFGRYEVYIDGKRVDMTRRQLKLKSGSRLRKLKDTPTGRMPV